MFELDSGSAGDGGTTDELLARRDVKAVPETHVCMSIDLLHQSYCVFDVSGVQRSSM